MILTVVAQRPADYSAWLAHEREDAVSPVTDQQKSGQMPFLTRPCVTCHAVRGINNPANLAAWATHAQSLKPGAHMPNVTSFDGEELQALVAYPGRLK